MPLKSAYFAAAAKKPLPSLIFTGMGRWVQFVVFQLEPSKLGQLSAKYLLLRVKIRHRFLNLLAIRP